MLHCFNSYANLKSTHYRTVQNGKNRLSLKKSRETMVEVPLNLSFQFIKWLSLEVAGFLFWPTQQKEVMCEV
jgi:hypothetical protein